MGWNHQLDSDLARCFIALSVSRSNICNSNSAQGNEFDAVIMVVVIVHGESRSSKQQYTPVI